MAIKAKNTTGVKSILAADTTIYTVQVDERVGVEAINIHNTTAADITVNFFISPDLTSASGDRVGSVILSANDEEDVNSIVGQGYIDGDNIIAVADAVGVNCAMTYTLFTDTDA